MKIVCQAAVTEAIGRELKQGEADGITARILKWQNLLGKRDNATWRSLSGSQRLSAAAEAAAKEIISDLAKKKQRINLMVPVMDRIENSLNGVGVTPDRPLERLKALGRLIAWSTSNKEGTGLALESSAMAQEKLALGQLRKALLATNPKVMGLFEDKAGLHDLIREIYGEDTKNPVAREAAESWRSYTDEARDRYNANGGDIGKLGEHYFPQNHDPYRVGQARLETWLSHLLPLLDRDKYLRLDGTRMSDKEVRTFMTHAFDNIINDGASKYEDMKLQPDALNKDMFAKKEFGYGLYADRNAHHRQIFFKDADSFMAYQQQYGGHSLYSMLEQHVRRMARDTAVLERFGPYADQAFAYINDREARAARGLASDKLRKINAEESFNKALYDNATGRTLHADTRGAKIMQGVRNVLTGLRLEKVILTAMGDEAGMYATALANKIPYGQILVNEAKLLNPADRSMRRDMEAAGLGLQCMLGSMNRFGGELYGGGWTARFANVMMRVSGAERMWDTRRQAIGAALMYHMGQLSRELDGVHQINETEHGVLARKGLTQSAWDTFKAARLDHDGRLTPKQIWEIPDENLGPNATALKREAATALMAHVHEEAGMGVMDTGVRQKTLLQVKSGGLTTSEVGRSILLFKTFASSVMLKHWNRMGSMGTLGSKAGYGAALGLYGTAIALTFNSVRNLIGGVNPPDLTSVKTWAGAVLRGGGLGYFGDFLYDAETSNENTLLESLMGPVGTAASDVWNVTGVAAFKAAKGERTDEGANLIRLGRNNMPFTQLWYASAIFDHLLWNNLQEAANPGYLDRMQERQAKYGRTYWWNPHDTLPDQGPNFGAAVGKQ